MINQASTRHRIRNDEYPKVMIHWQKSSDIKSPAFTGPDSWQGDATVWWGGNTKSDITFIISLGQSAPLGGIHYSLNPGQYGARAFSSIPGTGIGERDLLWCGEWAISTMREEIMNAHAELSKGGENETFT